jgi:hypothetical protein
VSGSRPPLRVIESGGPPRPLLAPALELAALGAGLTLAMALIGALPVLHQRLGAFQALYAIGFAFLGLALLRMSRYAAVPRTGVIVLTVALAARVPLLFAAPSLSDDVYRYVWEGTVIAHGGNPYAQAPDDPGLAALRDLEIHPRVNHPELAAIYPPLAEAGFALVAAIAPSVFAFKLWVLLHDLLLVLVLLALLRREGRPPLAAIAYAWNPLVIVEFAGSGHNDPTAMLWLAVAWLLARRHPALSALALGAGALVKLVPLVTLPLFLARWPWRARLTVLGVLVPGLGLFWALTRDADSGLAAYWSRWRNNELVFHVLEGGLGFERARFAALAIVGGAILWALWRRRETLAASRLVLRMATVVAPVVHPWYLGWTLIAEPLRPSAPWLLFSLTAVLNYGVLATPAEGRDFHLSLGGRAIEYGLPLALAAALAAWRRLRAARPPGRL